LNDVELALHVKQTARFIEWEPESIVILRPIDASDGSGGKKRAAPITLLPQVVRLVVSGRVGDTRSVINADGEIQVESVVIIGLPDLDIQEDDEVNATNHRSGFMTKWKVKRVNRKPVWATRAEVEERG
jgi:hypothetical protein